MTEDPRAAFEAAIERMARQRSRDTLSRVDAWIKRLSSSRSDPPPEHLDEDGNWRQCRTCKRRHCPDLPPDDCIAAEKAIRWAKGPRAEVLASCGVPDIYREEFHVERTRAKDWPAVLDIGSSKADKKPVSGAGRVDQWAGRPSTLTLLGVSGAGKSRMAAEMMWRLIVAGKGRLRSGFWITGWRLLEEENAYRLGEPAPASRVRARASDVLVFDDLGQSDREAGFALRLVEERMAARRPTIVTTHLKMFGATESLVAFSAALARRLLEGQVALLENVQRGGGA